MLRPVLAAIAVTIPLTVAAPVTAAQAAPVALADDPAAYVNPFIGTTNLGNTYPGAVRPFGMLAWSPQTSRGNQISTPAPGGYQYTATKIRGLSLTHLSGVGCSGANGDIPIMPYAGSVTTSPSADATDALYASTFSHANEAAEPGYYRVGLDSGAGAELTVTDRTGLGRFTFPAGKPANLLFRTSLSETGSADATVHIDPATRTVTGSVSAGNFCGPQSTDNSHAYYTLHFVAQLDQPFAATGTWTDGTLTPDSTDASGGSGYSAAGRPVAGKGSGGYVTFAPGTTSVGMRVAIAYTDQAGAERNLAAESTGGFDAVRAAARKAWTDRLSKIRIGGGTRDQLTTFYTALYHAALEPTLTSDVDGRYRGADDRIHQLSQGQHAQYGTFSGWDVYRAQVQLLAMLDRRQASDYAQSLFNYATQRGGEWDRWLLEHGKTAVMSGDPAAAAIAGLYAFGARDFDAEGALSSLVRAATVPTANDSSDRGCNVECVGQRPSLDFYLAKGYVPADDCHCWGGAAETLEDAAADYGIAQLAGALGDLRTYKTFMARSLNWRNVYDPEAKADPGLEHNIREHITAVTASGENPPYEGKAQAFDGDKGTKWLTFATTGWVAAKLDAPRTVDRYALTSGNDEPGRDPADWRLQGSNDGSAWTTVDTQTGQAFEKRGQTRTYEVSSPQSFAFYRLDVVKNGGADIVQLGELELADPAAPTPAPLDSPFAGWMRDKYRDGTWAEGFSPSTGTGFVEGSSAQYTWMVYSDVVTLAQRMGGNDVAEKRLDAFFRNPDGTFDLTATKPARFDATNEPDIQTPYLYNYFGAAYKTQETVKAIVDGKWSNGTGGIPGNDDAGTMSAWYVFSALGLYPTVPTRAELALTTPLFPRAVVTLGSGKELTIDAPGTETSHYVQALKVDGKRTTKAWLPARTVTAGGHLTYTLGTTPNYSWGSMPADVPPQN
ncbi:GH92 family glycosyl hydrolase [Actinoplanes sp. CA-030573]|uniref:GH92 family glycosyl hydrolase n=1 Tax=Actinoplanes sp. CA-030573 TaxID=3239898 RepID=UPI003D91294A